MAYLSRAVEPAQRRRHHHEPDSQVISIRTDDLEQASDACRHRFDRAFMAILVERLTMANSRITAV